MNILKMIVFTQLVYSLLLTAGYAENKTIIIPLTRKTSLEPYAPVTAISPGDNDYDISVLGYVVIDNVTRLMWQQGDSTETKTWGDAHRYCASLEPPPFRKQDGLAFAYCK